MAGWIDAHRTGAFFFVDRTDSAASLLRRCHQQSGCRGIPWVFRAKSRIVKSKTEVLNMNIGKQVGCNPMASHAWRCLPIVAHPATMHSSIRRSRIAAANLYQSVCGSLCIDLLPAFFLFTVAHTLRSFGDALIF